MTPVNRTIVFAGVATGSVILAMLTSHWIEPSQVDGFNRFGEKFFVEFTDPNESNSLRVMAFDADTATKRQFNVELVDGNWVIPSHHNYPAEATNRLAETSASVNGIERGALKTRRKADHKRFGVIDPHDENISVLSGRGKRVRLAKGDKTLADFIIGNPVPGETDTYFVRATTEDAVYATKIKIDLSTKFADWIEPDLLKLDRDTVTELVIDKSRTAGESREVLTLTREKFADDWQLADLDTAKEEVKDSDVDTLAQNIDELKIVGVRPKPPFCHRHR